jgi:hypothetical protein
MTNGKPEQFKMLANLIDEAAKGKKIALNTKPIREVIRLKQEGQDIDSVILSMEYSGTVNGDPFAFKKEYSFAYDEAEYALESLLIANNRLQMDYERLKEAGIVVKGEFFSFQNSFLGLPGDASLKKPALRLQDFIQLMRAGGPVSVGVTLKCPDMIVRQANGEKKGFGRMVAFEFTTGESKTTIEKLYNIGCYDDTAEAQAETKEVANKRLARDCERLRSAGMKVDELAF